MALDDDLGPALRAAVWLLTGLSGAFLGTRLYCKWRRHGRLHLDDGFLVAAWVTLAGGATCTTIEVGFGFGRHTAALLQQVEAETAATHRGFDTDAIALTGQLAITLGICAQAWSKTSWALTLLRVVTGRARAFVWFALVSMNLFFAGPALGYWLQCQPVSKAWHPQTPGTCWRPEIGIVLGIVATVYSGIMDLAFAVLPWLLLRHLHVDRAERLGITLAMSMGVFAAACAFAKAAAMPSLTSPDFTYTGVPLTVWGVAEPAVTIMAASVPMMRVLVQSMRKPSPSWYEGGRPSGHSDAAGSRPTGPGAETGQAP